MQTVYRLNANELTSAFIEGIKAVFRDKEIEIMINEVDETEYLTATEENKKRLLAAIENVKQNANLVEVVLD